MKTVTKYVAFDGKDFDDENACLAHEKSLGPSRLVGLTSETVIRVAKVYRLPIEDRADEDIDIAEAIEKMGSTLARERRESGDLKRARKPKTEVSALQQEPEGDGA